MKKYDVVISGYTCVDLVPEFSREEAVYSLSTLLIPGKLNEIDGIDFILGGVVANTGIALKKYNKKVYLNGLVGDDTMGKIAKEWLEKYNVSEGIQTTKIAGTAVSIVIAPPGIDRIFLESPGCNRIFDISFIHFDVISECKIFHFGYPPLLRQFYLNKGSQMVDMLSKVQKMGIVTSLDFSLPDPASESGKINWTEVIEAILPFTDIFVPSLEELLQICMPMKYAEIQIETQNTDFVNAISLELIEELGKQIIDLGAKILLIKAGHRGAYLFTGDVSKINEKTEINLSVSSWNFRNIWCEPYHVDVTKIINSTGAGDTAVAAFLSAIIDGHSAESALKHAALAGRNNLYCQNIFADLSSWDEMTKEIELSTVEVVSL